MIKPYERLSQVYDLGWGDFSKRYIGLINELLQERGVTHARILDIACGTGALAIDLARRGHSVQGLDISPEMIGIANSKSIGLRNISFGIQDMVKFNVDGKFDLITCTFDSVNYVNDLDDLREMLFRVASALREAGLFVFDSNTKKLYLSHADETQKRELDGQSFLQHCSYDHTRNEATVAFSFSDGTFEIHRQRPYELQELNPLLSDAGLNIVHLFSWFDKRPCSSNTQKLFCIAERLTK